MKITAPKTSDDYFRLTEHAVRHAYSGLDSCWAYFEEGRRYSTPPIERDGMLHYLPPTTPEEKARLDRCLELQDKYFELKISEAMFAGSILQAAYMAIWLYRPKSSIPMTFAHLVKPSKLAARFCTGKERHGVPTGLIIYAARNQYNHWGEDENLHELNQLVFAMLDKAFSNDPFADLAFDLGNPTINIYANEVLFTALRWNTYDTYLAEMSELFS